ncbi:MAG: hypothetical protein WBQ24_13675 [Xanthobacteraceae bacterium]
MGKKKRERVMLRRFRMVLRDIWVASGEPGGAYRPDLHYMRGPGPKWHAKYGHLYPKSQPALRPATSTLGDIAERHA